MLASNDLIRVAPESGPSDFFEVRVASLPVPVRIEYSAIRDLRSGFDGKSKRIGLLLGSSSPQAVSIKRCELLSFSPDILADPKSLRAALHQFVRTRLRTPLEEAPELLGSFRTETAESSGISDSDLKISKRSFPELDPIFLLIRTPEHRPWTAALYALEANAAAPSEPAMEFSFDEYLLSNGYSTALAESPQAAGLVMQPGPAQQIKTNWILAAALGAMVLGTSATAAHQWYGPANRANVAERNGANAGSMGLKVNRSGNDFEVSWDRLSAAVQQSTSAKLTISDGALSRAVTLSGAQLREGRILYAPLFDELTFRLEVANRDLGATAESVQVLAWNGKQTADTSTIAATAGPTSQWPTRKLRSSRHKNSKRDSGTNTLAAAVRSTLAASANIGTSASMPEAAGVIQPSLPNPARGQDVAPATPVRVAETLTPVGQNSPAPSTPVLPPPAVAPAGSSETSPTSVAARHQSSE